MTRRAAVAGLWIAPDLWKTRRTRFPQVLGRADRAHTLHRRTRLNENDDDKLQ